MKSASVSFRDVLSRSHLPALDGLRAVAVLTVIAAHAHAHVRVPADLGVSAFFVLSGFLITRLLMREHHDTGEISIPRFYFRRTMRIFPAYYAFVLISYVVDAHAGQAWSRGLLISTFTYTVNYFNALNHHPTTSVAHAWSLAVEEQFYLLWPVVFTVLAARGRRALVVGVGAAAAATLLWRSGLILISHIDVAYAYNAFDTRLDNLAIGCLLALVGDRDAVVRGAAKLARRAWYPYLTIAALLVSRLALPKSYHYSVGFTIDAILVGILITQLLLLYRTRWWSWLEWPAVRYLGAISYPMYLYHQWGASVGRRLMGTEGSLEFAAGVMATVLLASGSYFLIERPFLKLKGRYSARFGQPTSVVEEVQQPSVAIA